MYTIKLNKGVKNNECFVVVGNEILSNDPIVNYNIFSKQDDLFAFTIQYWHSLRTLGPEGTPLDLELTSNAINLGRIYNEEDEPFPDFIFEKLIYKDFQESSKFGW
ncbi:hypothetical protein Rm378p054 [Rhodothermus phage RM378]|uniref:hypothetical protein n=1 Tax=Rhodothermus phage RM378 TaxID=148943 RepID=UPI000018F63F|nr:hypothetical protein Rm378p054 [Rhodothermus phage RM378]